MKPWTASGRKAGMPSLRGENNACADNASGCGYEAQADGRVGVDEAVDGFRQEGNDAFPPWGEKKVHAIYSI